MPTIITFPTSAAGAPGNRDAVRVAYDALAPAYDAFTAGYRHDLWLAKIERIAIDHGLRGKRLLDVACGTGKSFVPLLERGYTVTACDISPEMTRRATAKAPDARVLVADMCRLPALGPFDLVTCLNDALNYVLDERDLLDALAGIARQLAPEGVAIWDVNTARMMRESFSSDWAADRGEWFLTWRGTAGANVGPGAVVEAQIDAFRHRAGTWQRTTSRHRQRHWPVTDIVRLARDAGLEIVQVLGQHRGAQLEPAVDEERHIKALIVSRRAAHARDADPDRREEAA